MRGRARQRRRAQGGRMSVAWCGPPGWIVPADANASENELQIRKAEADQRFGAAGMATFCRWRRDRCRRAKPEVRRTTCGTAPKEVIAAVAGSSGILC